MDTKQRIKSLIASLDLDAEIGDIYFCLLRFGPQTMSDLAKTSAIERTKLYRLLPKLQSLKLIEVELHPHRHIIQAAPIENVQILIDKKQAAHTFAQIALRQLEQEVRAGILAAAVCDVARADRPGAERSKDLSV